MTTIHTSLPNKVKRRIKCNSQLLRSVAVILRQCRGRRQAITATTIASKLGFQDTPQNNHIRKAVKILFNDYSAPILSCGEGFYWAAERSELVEFIKTEQERLQGIERNITTAQAMLTSFP